jgi:hypothetical protein
VALSTLRLLAVYFGTAVTLLYIAHHWIRRISLPVGIFLCLAPSLLVGKALVTGGVYAPLDIAYRAPPLSAHAHLLGATEVRTPALGDVVYQMIPFRKAVREAAKNGRLPLWDRFILAGEPLLALQQPAALHPATLIGFLLPLAEAWTFEMAFRFFLSLLAAYLYLRDLSCGEVPSLIGAVGWAFSDYLVFYAGYPHLAAAAAFPLLLLGLRRLAREQSLRSVVLTVVSILAIVTSGHPETLLHAAGAGGIYFLFELRFAGRGRRLRPLLLSLASGVVAFGLAAVLILPLIEALPHSQEHFFRSGYYAHVKKSVSVPRSLEQLLPAAVPYVYGVSGKSTVLEGFLEPSSYAGAALWPFLALGLLSKAREKWALLVIGLMGVLIRAHFPLVTDAISAIPLFDIALNERMAFLGAFATAALAALGADRISRQGARRGLVTVAVGALLCLLILAFANQSKVPADMPQSYLQFRLLVQAVPLVLLALLGLAFRSRKSAPAVVVGALATLLVQRNLEEGRLYPTYPSKAFFPPLESVSRIPRDAPERMTAVGFTFIPNVAALYEIEDVRGYEAMTFRPLYDTYPLWCVHQPVWFNRVDDPTKPFLAFLNVRYVLASPGYAVPRGWKVLFEGAEGILMENPAALSRAFVPRSVRCEPEGRRRLESLGEIQDFAEQGVVDRCGSTGSSDSWSSNGRALVRIQSYRPQSMVLAIDATEPTLVATSVTAWPGWKLELDGSRSELVGYNHAFLGFRVPAGRHTAVLRYRPDGFVAGAAISAATLAIVLLLASYRRISGVREPSRSSSTGA